MIKETLLKIPNKLKIGGHIYKVTEKDLGEDKCGDMDRKINEINVNIRNAQSQKIATLIHEVLHCFDITMPEAQVESLENQIFAFLVDNKFISIK